MNLAVVTGASSGIGQATAELLAGNGFHVIAAARRIDRLKALAEKSPNIEAFQLDVTDQASVDNLVESIGTRGVALLVNNAGGAFDSAPIEKADPAIWQKTYDVNVLGTLRVTKALLPALRANSSNHIVVVTSTAGHSVMKTAAATLMPNTLS